MPRKKKVDVEEQSVVGTPLLEVFAEPEVKIEKDVRPRRHMVFITKAVDFPELQVTGSQKVGTVSYWESTDDITYDYELGFQVYMDNFVGRDIEVGDNEWVQRINTRTWVENLCNARLIDGYSASKVRSFYEND